MALGTFGSTLAVPAAVAAVTCGRVITSNTTLSSDIGPCLGDGIIIGANNITLNLAGHTVSGANIPSTNSVGIHLTRRHGVTITAGTVTGFASGVAIVGGSRNTISKIFAHDNVGLQDGDFGDGIGIFNSSSNSVTGNVANHNGPFDGIGVFGNGVPGTGNSSQGNQVVSNVVTHSNLPRDPGGAFSTDVGINLGYGLNGPSFTTVATNVVRDGGFDGIVACSESGNPCLTTDDSIVGNLIERNGFAEGSTTPSYGEGIRVHAITPGSDPQDFQMPTRISILNNRVTGNAADGIFVASTDNTIIGNDAAGNDVLEGGLLFDLNDNTAGPAPKFSPCYHNVWRSNKWGRYFNDDPQFGPVGLTPFGSFNENCTAAGGSGPRPGFLFSFNSPLAARESPQRSAMNVASSQRRMPQV